MFDEFLSKAAELRSRVITLDLRDEVFGVGMPCGGVVKVYIEPYLPKPELVIVGRGRIVETVARLGHLMAFSVTVNDPGATREAFPTADRLITADFASGEITVGPNSYVVIATQHKGDHLSMKMAMKGRPAYLALIASRKRSQLVLDYLLAAGVSREELARARVRAPAGLDIGARTPEEIALSITGEIVAVRRGGSGRPMVEAKGIEGAGEEAEAERLDQVIHSCVADVDPSEQTGRG